jgi:hypothetical protein
VSDPRLEDAAHARARRMRNIVTAVALGVFVVLVFIVSIIRLSGHAF